MPIPRNIWILVVGEPLPLDGPDERLLRAGLLANCLVGRGHKVTWWTSAFDHRRKTFRDAPECVLADGIEFRLLKGSGYRRNVSFRRVRDQREVAREFARRAPLEAELPDVLFVAYPTVELADAAETYAAGADRPLVVDVRDLWPDIFADLVPPFLRGLAKVGLMGMTKQSSKVLRRATAITAITESFVDWGVERAGRTRGPNDRAFPLAYDHTPLSSRELLVAEETLRNRGIRLSSERARVVFTGSLGKQFDFDTVFEAADKVRDLPVDFIIA
jgi:glycosyltransferase involved in cell wall biosynthesis